MAVFPQLVTGATVQYPVRRILKRPAFRRESGDGTVRYSEGGPASERWDLVFENLTIEEVGAISALHRQMAGRVGTFLFLDPTENQLKHSEELLQPVWVKAPLLDAVGNVDDPTGGQDAFRLTNNAGVSARLYQTLGVPGTYQYSLSAFVRFANGGTVWLTGRSGGQERRTEHAVSPVWTRVSAGISLGTGSEVEFGLELPPNGSCELFGLQVDAQPHPGPYRRSGVRGGVVERARFEDDQLAIRALGVNEYSLRTGIVRAA